MKRGTPEHPKTLRLAVALGIPRFQAVGLLEMLWHFTARFAPRGDVGRWPDEEIARAMTWVGDPGKLISALAENGWIDSDKAYRFVIHDWAAHCDQGVRKYLARNKLRFATLSGRRPSRVRTQSGPPLPLPLPSPQPTENGMAPPPEEATPPPPERLPAAQASPAREALPAPREKPWPSQRAADVYLRHYPKARPPQAMFHELKPLVKAHGWDVVEPELDAYLSQTPVKWHSWPKFSSGFGTWTAGNGHGAGNGMARGRPTAAEVTGNAVRKILAEEAAKGRQEPLKLGGGEA